MSRDTVVMWVIIVIISVVGLINALVITDLERRIDVIENNARIVNDAGQ